MTHTSGPPFTKVRMREGYDMDDVDTFLAEVEHELLGPLPNPGLARRITGARFTPVRVREGYDMGEVDQYLDELERRALVSSANVPAYVPAAASVTAPALRRGESVKPQNTFRVSRVRGGYSISEVDAFISTIMHGLAGRLPNESLAQYIRGARFTPVNMPQRGYDMQDVDEHLDHLHAWAMTGKQAT